jgi:CheY-like chemotaxis protein
MRVMAPLKRTLVVSPDPGLANQARGALEQRGGRVHTARSGEEALGWLASESAALVIAEVGLAGMSGYELCRRLKERDPSPRVVLVRPANDDRAPGLGRDCGADALLARPFPGHYLASQVESLMGAAFFIADEAPADIRVSRPRLAAVDRDRTRAAVSIVEPRTGVFGEAPSDPKGSGTQHSLVDESDWGDSAASAQVRPLDTGELESVKAGGGGQTEELPAVAVEVFDEEHPVSVPVSPVTTAHFLPSVEESEEPAAAPAPAQPASRAGKSSSGSQKPVRVEPVTAGSTGGRITALNPATGSAVEAFLGSEAEAPAEARALGEAVAEQLAALVAPDGAITRLIQDSVRAAVAEALKASLPVVASEAARLAQKAERD